MTGARDGGVRGQGVPALPSPGVCFTPALLRRFGTFAARLAAGREREDVGRRRALQGEGEEFVGHRPYRRGDDLRHLDWALLARRRDRPFVRVHRADVSEEWLVAVDTSASMGVGRPGKLQSAAEAAGAALALGLRLGARITLVVPPRTPGEGVQSLVLSRRSDLGRGLDALGSMVAGGPGCWGHIGAGSGAGDPFVARRGGAGRILLLGDLVDVDPTWAVSLGRGRRHVHLGQVFAPEEWDPRAHVDGAAVWIDPERPDLRRAGAGDGEAAYLARLEGFVERWARLARDHRMSHAVWRSDEPFEDHLPALLR